MRFKYVLDQVVVKINVVDAVQVCSGPFLGWELRARVLGEAAADKGLQE
jgi:hypothetical protein